MASSWTRESPGTLLNLLSFLEIFNMTSQYWVAGLIMQIIVTTSCKIKAINS